jgi:nitrite reductase (NADH) small subunit
MTATASRITLCTLDDVPLGLGRAFVVGDVKLAVFRTRSGRVFAVDGVCPHKGGPLADGMLGENDRVVCPYHGYRFDPASGECDQPGPCAVATYPTDVIDGTVVVTI